jgi:hypothetical protein
VVGCSGDEDDNGDDDGYDDGEFYEDDDVDADDDQYNHNDNVNNGDGADDDVDDDDDDDDDGNVFNGSGKRRLKTTSTSTSSTYEDKHIRKQAKPASAVATANGTAAATPVTPKTPLQLLKSPFVQEVESIRVAQDRIAALSASIASVSDPARRLQLLKALHEEQSLLMHRAEQLHAAQATGASPRSTTARQPASLSRRNSLAAAAKTATPPPPSVTAAAELVPMSSFDIRGMLAQLDALEADFHNGQPQQQQQQQQQPQQPQQQSQQQQQPQQPQQPQQQQQQAPLPQQVHYSIAPGEEARQQYGEMKLIAHGSPGTPLLSSKNRRAAELFRTPSFAVTDEGVPAWLFAGRQQRSVRRAPSSQRGFGPAEPTAYYPPRAPHTLGLSESMDIRAELSRLVASLSAAECDGALLLLRTVYDIGSATQDSIGDLCAEVASMLHDSHVPAATRDELDRSFDELDHQRVAIVDSVRKENRGARQNDDGDDNNDDDDAVENGNGVDNRDDDEHDELDHGDNEDDLPALTGAALDAARRGMGGNVQYDTTRAVLEARAMLSQKKFASYETAATVRREHALRNKRTTDGLAQLNDKVISLSPGDIVHIRGAP